MASGEDTILILESITQGHHVYRDIWLPMMGEILDKWAQTSSYVRTEVWYSRWPHSQRIFWDIMEEYLEVTGRRKHCKGLEDSISSRLLTWSIIGFALSGISISYLTILTKHMHLTRPGRKYVLMTKCALIRKVRLTTRVYSSILLFLKRDTNKAFAKAVGEQRSWIWTWNHMYTIFMEQIRWRTH